MMNKLKIFIPAFIIFITLVTYSCIKDDLNSAPGTITLIAPLNATNDVALNDSLTWQEAIDPDGDLVKYDVYFGTEPDPEIVVKVRLDSTTFTPILVAGTTYYWKVDAKDGREGKSESAVWSFTTISPNNPPGEFNLTSPTNGATNITHDDVLLRWNTSTDPDGDAVTYDVLLGTNANPTTVVSTEQTGTTFTPTLTTGTTYYWKVIAKDGNGGTSESAVWSFTTISPNSPPAIFALISPANGAIDNLYIDFLLEWNASTDPDGDAVTYDVILSTDANPTTVISSNQTGTTYGTTLTNGTTYYWKVIAKDGNGGTRESAVWSFITLNYEPGEINLTAPNDVETDVALDANLTWDIPSDQDGDALTYDVYFGTNETPTSLVSNGQAGTSYSPALSENTIYYWKIVAHDGNRGIGYSPVWSFTTLSPNSPPNAFNLRSPTNGAGGISINPTLTWYAATDPDGDAVTYDVYFGTSKTNITVVSSDQTGTSYNTSTLNSNVSYFWKVVAKDGIGGTSESAGWSFTTVIF